MAHFEFVGKDHIKRGCDCPLEECSLDCSLRRKLVNKPTNADHIRAMTDYELADWISEVLTYHAAYVQSVHEDCNNGCPLYDCCNNQPYDNIEDWLKSPVEVDND